MKTFLAFLFSCLTLSAATTYPVLTDSTNRLFPGGVTNVFFLNSNVVTTGTMRATGVLTLTNSGNVFAGDGSGLTGISAGISTSGGSATNLSVYSSGTTNRPLRVFSTNGLTAYYDKDGNHILTNMIKWGETSSFPALKRSGTELQVRLADDSGYASLGIGSALTFAGGTAISFNGSELTSSTRFQSLVGISSETYLSVGPYPNYTYLYGDGSDVFAQRRSTNAQTFRVYGTASGSPGSDYVRASLSCSATAVTLAAESGGTGASNVNINITPAGTGGVAIGSGGSAISKVLSATASLNFDLTALTVEDKTMTVTGAAVGDVVTLGVPNGSVTTSVQYTAWVSAADTVTVRARTSATGEDPASGTFRATVIKH